MPLPPDICRKPAVNYTASDSGPIRDYVKIEDYWDTAPPVGLACCRSDALHGEIVITAAIVNGGNIHIGGVHSV